MVVNPDKFQGINLDKKQFDITSKQLVIDNQVVKTVLSVELLGIQLRDKVSFDYHSLTFAGLPDPGESSLVG